MRLGVVKLEGLKPRRYEGIINALIFVAAIITLLVGSWGVLTFPGIGAAVIAIYFIYKKRYQYSAVIGLFTAIGSFTAQYITVFCPTCTIAATLFAISAMISILLWSGNDIKIALAASAVILTALFVMITMSSQTTVQPQTIKISQASMGETTYVQTDKALLYIMPGCKHCKPKLKEFIANDPKGDLWQPVITPQDSLYQGEKMLKELGYQGTVLTAAKPPDRFIPALVIDDQLYRGDEITYIKIKEEDNADS